MASYQQRVGDAVTVVTVHQDENETAALLRMAELGVRLPVLQDGCRSIAAALALPNVMPATVVLRRDGSVANELYGFKRFEDDGTDRQLCRYIPHGTDWSAADYLGRTTTVACS